ncbi:hypothetical protein WA026_008319 [Henosepilachna vigintioctopunctata]|uniref:Uncharacterized protein n=1 Tax=Henosepilachna vigintioctopunctata TaxID=420089 RepID=A0AAW1UGA3_9CUCU
MSNQGSEFKFPLGVIWAIELVDKECIHSGFMRFPLKRIIGGMSWPTALPHETIVTFSPCSDATKCTLLDPRSAKTSGFDIPAVMNAKKEAWKTLRSDYCSALKKEVTVGQLIKALNNVKPTVKKKTDVKVTENRKIKLEPWEKIFLKLIEDDYPVFHKIPGNISVGTSAEPPVQQPTSDNIQESLQNTETEGQPNKNEEPKSQERTKPMNIKSDADHHENKIRKSEKIVLNHAADET